MREGPFLLALGMLAVASLVVGVSGWVLYLRDRRTARAGAVVHREATEES
jgi:hypothetical protein